jgi:spore coat protein A
VSFLTIPHGVRLPSTRRTFLQQASAFTLLSKASPLLGQTMHDHMAMPMPAQNSAASTPHPTPPMLHCLQLAPFVDALPVLARLHPHRGQLRIAMRQIHTKLHRDVPPTRLWVYAAASDTTPSAAAPVIEARSNQPLQVEWLNQLPTQHFLPIDHSLHGCGTDIPDVRAITHLHGARTASKDDGYPTDWFLPGQSRICHYPFQQDAATLWFHDHAMGLNRLNTYAGLVGMTLLRDHTEDALDLPSGPYELPLTLYDRNFTADGQLFYPSSEDPAHPWVPEFSGDAILVNGKIRPFVEVQPRLYRLRVLNAANSRFFSLAFSNAHPFHQIGTDQGLLPAPVKLTRLTLAPAERADILIDLSTHAGQNLHLLTGAFEILQLRVANSPAPAQPTTLPTQLRSVTPLRATDAVTTRTITLNEYQDDIARPMVMLLNRKHWHEPVTETPKLNTTEIWEFVNLTEDTHPMHLHLVRFQLLDRRVFDTFSYTMYKQLKFQGDPIPPEPNELGWKDVIQCPAGMITRIIVHFDGYAGNYLYHCHVLEHEANDMMRPFQVIA